MPLNSAEIKALCHFFFLSGKENLDFEQTFADLSSGKYNDLISCVVKLKMDNKIAEGDTVKTRYDIWESDHTPVGSYNLGPETYTVSKVEFWPQGEGNLIYGNSSDKRSCRVWHHENDLIKLTTNTAKP